MSQSPPNALGFDYRVLVNPRAVFSVLANPDKIHDQIIKFDQVRLLFEVQLEHVSKPTREELIGYCDSHPYRVVRFAGVNEASFQLGR